MEMLRIVAGDPEREWTLSELSRAIDVHPASCQTILLALVQGGVLQRRGTRPIYSLGPMLTALGDRARGSIDIVKLVEPELTALRDRHNATAFLGMVSGASIVATSVWPAHQPMGYGVVPYMAVPFRAPIGSVYVAWDSAESIEAWLRRGQPEITATRARALRSDLAVIRARGWSATLRTEKGANGFREVGEEVGRNDDFPLLAVSAPVRRNGDEITSSLALTMFPERVSGRRLLAMARDLTSAADRVESASVRTNLDRA
jgi:DNA-binding IclR family transcriptional regulator